MTRAERKGLLVLVIASTLFVIGAAFATFTYWVMTYNPNYPVANEEFYVVIPDCEPVVCLDLETLDSMKAAVKRKDATSTAMAHINRRTLVVIHKDAYVRVTKVERDASRVEIVSGGDKGTMGWVANEWFQNPVLRNH